MVMTFSKGRGPPLVFLFFTIFRPFPQRPIPPTPGHFLFPLNTWSGNPLLREPPFVRPPPLQRCPFPPLKCFAVPSPLSPPWFLLHVDDPLLGEDKFGAISFFFPSPKASILTKFQASLFPPTLFLRLVIVKLSNHARGLFSYTP